MLSHSIFPQCLIKCAEMQIFFISLSWVHTRTHYRAKKPANQDCVPAGYQRFILRRSVQDSYKCEQLQKCIAYVKSNIDTIRQAMYIQRNNEVRSRNHFCSEQAVSITYSECVTVALVIQHAKTMRNISMFSVACVGYTMFFSALSHIWHDFRKKTIIREICDVCLDFLYKFCPKYF